MLSKHLSIFLKHLKPVTPSINVSTSKSLNSTLQNSKRYQSTYKKIQSLVEPTPIAQGVRGPVELITGNFTYFTRNEAKAIASSLEDGKALVLVFDRDSIPVPANERAMWIREYFKHNPHLEVRVAYGPPPEKKGNEDHYISYIKKQLPPHIQITEVRCDNYYSELLAKHLKILFNPAPELKNSGDTEQAIKQNPMAYKEMLFPVVAQRVISPFKHIINEHEFQQLCESEKVSKADIQQLNVNHPNEDSFFTRTQWNLAALNQINCPIVIGMVGNQYRIAFSNRTNAQVFDMPIYMPGQGWKIPVELSPYQNTLAKIVAAESLANNTIYESNVYVTIDCGVVFPNGYARREGLHVDGFLTKANARAGKDGVLWGDNTYIVSDSQDLQTEFYPGPFDLSQVDKENPQAVLKALDTQGRTMHYQQANAYNIVRLTTNNVHAVHPNLTNHYIQRSFLKVTFSERLFNRGGNTINPNFNPLMYVPRVTGRNTQNFIGIAPEGFAEVDLREIDFNALKFPLWVSSTPFTVHKKQDVHISAVPAIEGEILETQVDGQIVTTNIARAGDMKVTRSEGDSYFLGANFKKLYQPLEANQYVPTPRTVNAVRVAKNISFLANWGTRQNIPSGGYIVQDNQGDTWGVHQQSFEATYQKK